MAWKPKKPKIPKIPDIPNPVDVIKEGIENLTEAVQKEAQKEANTFADQYKNERGGGGDFEDCVVVVAAACAAAGAAKGGGPLGAALGAGAGVPLARIACRRVFPE